jgi:multimeric flavodoxin WrbA
MKAIGIVGSPRENGNTEYFTRIALEELKNTGFETNLILLKDKEIKPCRACYGCVKAKRCVIEDDFAPVFDEIVSADGLIIGSPVYHASMTPELKALLDRTGFSGRWASNEMKGKSDNYSWDNASVFSGKVGVPIAIARRAGHDFTFAQLLLWLTVNEFIVPGSVYWNIGMAGKGGARDAADDAEGIATIKHTAKNMAYIIKKLVG